MDYESKFKAFGITTEYHQELKMLTVYIPKQYSFMKEKIDKDELKKLHNARKVVFKTPAKVQTVSKPLDRLDVKIVESFSNLKNITNSIFAVDLETTSTDVFTCEVLGIGICTVYNEVFYTVNVEQGLKDLRELAKHNFFLVHNLSFEKSIFDRLDITPKYYLDSMVYNYVSADCGKSGLKDIVFARYGLKMTAYKELVGTGKKEKPFTEVPLDEQAQYCGADVYFTMKIYQDLKDKVDKEIVKLDHEASIVCMDMSNNGVYLDTPVFEDLSRRCKLRASRIESVIYKTIGREINLASPKQLCDLIYTELGIKPRKYCYNDEKRLSTSADVIAKLIDDGENHKILHYLKNYRNMLKIDGTYASLIEKKHPLTNRFHPYFLPTQTATGRLSSNIQQLPATGLGAKAREGIIPPKGYVFWAGDYSQIEIRILVHLMQDEKMVQAFKDGYDPHTAVASAMFNIPYEEVDKDGLERRTAKTLNFAVIYGKEANSLSEELRISKEEGQAFIDKYYDTYPNLKTLKENCLALTRERGYVTSISGRKRYIPKINSSNEWVRGKAEREAFNMLIQGTAADIMRVAMVKVNNFCKTHPEYGAKLQMSIHDELAGICRVDKIDDFLNKINVIMSDIVLPKCGTLIVPLKVDLNYGKNYWEAK
jgi:DNA polymerase-1